MYPGAIPEVKEVIRQTTIADAEVLAARALSGEWPVSMGARHS